MFPLLKHRHFANRVSAALSFPRPEGRDHVDHHEGMGGAVRSGAPIGNDLFGLV